jgi:Zn-dependent M28 family amino/carboxypeptidase
VIERVLETDSSPLRYVWYGLLVLTPATLTLLFMRGSRMSPGASDNLSGIAIVLECGRELSNQGAAAEQRPDQASRPLLEHTRVILASFGSEEAGMFGARAYVDDFYEELTERPSFFINLDTFKQAKEIQILRRELLPGTRSSPMLSGRMKEAFDRCDQPVKEGVMLFGATDAIAFYLRGIPSVTLMGLNLRNFSPTYHTRTDTLDWIEPEALSKARDIVLSFVKHWDKEPSKH